MQLREISVYNVGRTVVDREQMTAWIHSIDGCEEYELPTNIPNSALLTGMAAKACYKAFVVGANPNVTKIRTDMAEYLNNVMGQGHGSVFEHAVYNFGIYGITRVCTAELNRHRAGAAISEMSMRFVRFQDDIPFWMPLSVRECPTDDEATADKKRRTREVIEKALDNARTSYRELVDIWGLNDGNDNKSFADKKKLTSMFRRIVPMGVVTGGMWSFNIRALRHVLTMRCSPAAEEEIAVLASLLLKCMSAAEPELFGDFEEVDGFWRPKYLKI